MGECGVLVSCGHGSGLVRCSGVLFASKWVLTQGSLLAPAILNDQSSFSELLKTEHLVLDVPSAFKKKLPPISVIMDEQAPERCTSDTGGLCHRRPSTSLTRVSAEKFNALYSMFPIKDNKLTAISHGCSTELRNSEKICFTSPPKGDVHLALTPTISAVQSKTDRMPVERPAHLAGLWHCPLLARALSSLLAGWKMGENGDSSVPHQLRPVLVLLCIGEKTGDARAALRDLTRRVVALPHPKRGHAVLVEATPFGSSFFLNSWSQGIVSNVGGPRNCIILTDACTALGCEGGPIFRDDRSRKLIGLVISSLTWWHGEWVGYTLGIILKPVLQRLFADLTPSLAFASNNGLGFDDSVVLVRCGYGWGSGVVVDSSAGTILTCSHVVRKAPESTITIYCKGRHFPATLLYKTRDGLAYDIAVLHVTTVSGLSTLVIAKDAPIKGEEVLAVAFPLMSEHDAPMLRPTITRGIVAYMSNSMVQTTCCIQSGASGGAILSSFGELLALVVSNIVDTDSGALYPHVNMSIPSTAFSRPLELLRQCGNPTVLQCLESQDPAVQRTWALKHSSPNKL